METSSLHNGAGALPRICKPITSFGQDGMRPSVRFQSNIRLKCIWSLGLCSKKMNDHAYLAVYSSNTPALKGFVPFFAIF